jgi:hypothetical protein
MTTGMLSPDPGASARDIRRTATTVFYPTLRPPRLG